MPRARNIKHGFFTNDDLAENDPLGRLLFIGLWTLADYKGDLKWKTKRIKTQLLPYDECDVEALAINLDKSGFVRFYSDGENIYIRVLNFDRHQNPHLNEKKKGSDVPEYTDELRQLIDLKGLTINRDKSGSVPEGSASNPADSCFLIPDSRSLIPDSNTPPNPPEGEADSPEKKTGKPATKEKPTKQKTQSKASDFDWSQWPELPDQQILFDWFAMRKEKRAKVSQTVVDTFGREVTKAVQHGFTVDAVMAECVTRGWQGFKVEWLINQARGQANAPGQRIDNSAAGRIRANAQRELEEIRRQEESDHALATDGQHVRP